MDVAYDHIQEEALAPGPSSPNDKGKNPENPSESFNAEFQQAYKAISASPWGARIGGFLGNVKKQGESYYEATSKEYATKGFSGLRDNIVNRTRSLSLNQGGASSTSASTAETGETSKSGQSAASEEGLLSKIRKGAAQKMSEIEAAEARADEYLNTHLNRFGSNIGQFLRDAVTIAPPEGDGEGKEKVIVFEADGEDGGKKQIFITRLDAQLHLLHTNLELFKTNPTGESFSTWGKTFSAESRTEQISAELEKYPELRNSMEKLVPDSVQYVDFWKRYYFLRNELDSEEQKRKEVLKGATVDEEEVGWDEDESEADGEEEEEEEEEEDESEGNNDEDKKSPRKAAQATGNTTASTDTLLPKKPSKVDDDTAKAKGSADRASQPDSEASYDVVSAAASKAPSQAAGSPPKPKKVVEDSSDSEWE